MAQDTQAANDISIEKTLNKTDFGSFVNANKKPILIIFAVLLVLIGVISIVKYQGDKKEEKTLNKIFSISQSVFTPYLQGETKVENFYEKFKQIDSKNFELGYIAPHILDVSAKLYEDGKPSYAIEVLEKLIAGIGQKHELSIFVNLRLATLYENEGMNGKALSTYENLAQGNDKTLEAKTYLNLARLYMLNDKNDKAIKNFEFVIKNHEGTEEARLAKLYLNKMNL